MASVRITDEEFGEVQYAAQMCYDRGDLESAKALDKLARKMNLSLSKQNNKGYGYVAGGSSTMTWRDMSPCIHDHHMDAVELWD